MSSTTRVTSLMSGMDTEALIEEMLDAARIPLDNYEKDKTKVEWQRETLLELNSEMLAFQNSAFDMKLEGAYKTYTAESTNSLIAKAIAGTDAIEGTYTLKSSSLATATTMQGSKRDTAITSTAWVSSTGLNLSGTSMVVSLNGEKKTISFGDDEGDFTGVAPAEVPEKLEELITNKLNNAFGSEQIAVDVSSMASGRLMKVNFSSKSELNYPIVMTSGENDALAKLKIDSGSSNVFSTDKTIKEILGEDVLSADGTISLKVNGKTFEFSGDRTLSEVFKTISNDEDIDVNIKYDKITNSVIMKRDSTGGGRELDMSDEVGFFAAMGLTEDTGGVYTMGQNATVTITDPEGRTIENVQMTSNTFEYQGVSFSLLKADPNTEVSITVAKDTEKIYESIVGFVDKYNTLLGKLNQLYNEEKNKNYEPLTDKERESLSDTQQTKWDKLAKSGILRRDSTLQSAISSMRTAVTSVMGNSGINSLFQIGITTTSYSAKGNDNGKLIIDEEKLKEAINSDIDGVAKLFTSTPTNITGTSLGDETNLALNGKSMDITVGNNKLTLTFDKDYDISDKDSKEELLTYINNALASSFGKKNVTVSLANGRFVVSSLKQNTVTVNAGPEGNDALEIFRMTDGDTYDSKKIGFASRMYNAMSTAMESISEKAGSSTTIEDDSTLGKKVARLNDYIARQEDRLEMLEDRYYAQFAAMENALAQLNSQSSYISNMLGSDS